MVAVQIKSSGQPIPETYELLYVDVKSEHNRIPFAELAFIGGDIARQEFTISESGDFEPGKEVTIELGYYNTPTGKPRVVFQGIVLKQSMQMNSGGCVLIAELVDVAIKMTAYRQSNVFENMKDSAILSKLISENGLKAGTIATTTVQHKKMVQYACTDWDFLLSRAEANGLLVSVKEGTVSAKAPQISGAAAATYTMGIDEIYDFDMEADGRHQYSAVESSSWDIKGKKLSPLKKAKAYNLAQGNFKPATIAKAIGGKNDTLLSAVSLDEGETQAWADAGMMKSRLSMLKGRFKVLGDAGIAVGDIISIEGVGKRFSGKTLVTGVHHSYNTNGWMMDVQFGLAYDWFAAKQNIIEPKAAGLIPGVNGLQIGIVEKFEADPDKQNRVKVNVPAMNNAKGILWSRLATPSAGNNAGIFFQPEPGDEVILGFLNDDPRQPIILGAVHSTTNASPLKPADKNPEKGVVTKSGIKILLNDENKLLTLLTSDKNSIVINDKDKLIEIKDANNNIIKLSADGITLDSGKDIIIKSKGAIKMTASAKVEIKGSEIDIT